MKLSLGDIILMPRMKLERLFLVALALLSMKLFEELKVESVLEILSNIDEKEREKNGK